MLDHIVLVKSDSNIFFILQENGRQAGKLNFLYEADVEKWSNNNFEFSFSVSSFTFLYL